MRQINLPITLLLVIGLGSFTFAPSASAQVINACVSGGGNLRVVGDTSECRRNESSLSWNVQGPPGPEGPLGGSATVVDSVAAVVGSLLDYGVTVDDGRILIDVGSATGSIGINIFRITSDPLLRVAVPTFLPETLLYFTELECTGDAYYGTDASTASGRLIEYALVVNDIAYIRNPALLPSVTNIQVATQSRFAGTLDVCTNAAEMISFATPALSRPLGFLPPFNVQLP